MSTCFICEKKPSKEKLIAIGLYVQKPLIGNVEYKMWFCRDCFEEQSGIKLESARTKCIFCSDYCSHSDFDNIIIVRFWEKRDGLEDVYQWFHIECWAKNVGLIWNE